MEYAIIIAIVAVAAVAVARRAARALRNNDGPACGCNCGSACPSCPGKGCTLSARPDPGQPGRQG